MTKFLLNGGAIGFAMTPILARWFATTNLGLPGAYVSSTEQAYYTFLFYGFAASAFVWGAVNRIAEALETRQE